MSATNGLHLKLARRRLRSFQQESRLRRDHREALDSLDCEALLQLGIDAYDWLVRADQASRKSILVGAAEHDPQVEQALETLLRAWLRAAELADAWIAKVQERGHALATLSQFRECEDQVRASVRFLDQDEMTGAMRSLRDEAVAEHDHGETAEFV
jgi:hypothetical protein